MPAVPHGFAQRLADDKSATSQRRITRRWLLRATAATAGGLLMPAAPITSRTSRETRSIQVWTSILLTGALLGKPVKTQMFFLLSRKLL